jgi:Holliday junction resolvase RusA-like endonuclease
MPAITIEVPGVPEPKGRPRAGRTFGGGVRMYTPKKTESYEAKVAYLARQEMKARNLPLLMGPLRLEIEAYWPALQGTAKKRAHLTLPKATKPDFDNVAKAVCDALNGVAFSDDGQIHECLVRKWFAPVGAPARVVVHIATVSPEGNHA